MPIRTPAARLGRGALTYGFDIGTPDFAHTDCVLLWGNNPSETWLARGLEGDARRRPRYRR
ncbi:MAG: hypothetical protein R3E83_25530 [Burkholderiaceae bacterium]